MTSSETRPAFALSFDPRALTDLLQAPSDVRDLALAQLQDIVAARLFGTKLERDLVGCRKVYVDRRAQWRIVYAQRPAPANSAHRTEIHVVTIRRRNEHDVYDTARDRLGLTRRPTSRRTHAARTRSPQLSTRQPTPTPAPPPYAEPGLPQLASSPTRRGPAR